MAGSIDFKIKRISNGFIYSDSETLSNDFKTYYKDIDEIIEIIKTKIKRLV